MDAKTASTMTNIQPARVASAAWQTPAKIMPWPVQAPFRVARYIKEHRLLIAHEQLANTDVSIREIASMLGFSQVSNFSATFKAQFGYPPTSLRRKPATRSMS